MARKPYPSNVLEQGQTVLDSWREVNDEQTVGSLNPAALEELLTRFRDVVSRLNKAETQVNEIRNEYHDQAAELWNTIKRVRNGFKGIFGDDSYEFSLIGGTRVSDRKPPVRKTRTPKA